MITTCAYEGCDYDESAHRPYSRLRDGVPSVSTIAGLLDTGKSRSFGWAASLIAATTAVHETPRWWDKPTHPCDHTPKGLCACCRFIRSEFDRQWKAKAALGSHVHHLALQWAKGEDVEVDEVSSPYMDALEKFHVECAPDFVELERTVFYNNYDKPDLRYRGQFDFIASLTHEGKFEEWLVDIKTGGYHPVEQTLQLAAYRNAKWMTVWDDKTEVNDREMIYGDAAGVLMLRADGTYELIKLPANRQAFEMFLSLRAAWGWTREVEKWEKDRQKLEAQP